MKLRSIFLLFILSLQAYSQDGTEILRGRVSDGTSGIGISHCRILLSGNRSYEVQSDSAGYYFLPAEPGIYSVFFSHDGYKTILLPSVPVFSGKQKIVDVSMEEFRIELDSVPVSAPRTDENIVLDLWNMQRFAASFYDVARMSTSYAAIINTDDQANNVSIHGTSPNYVQWKLEGVEIVNPSHLENAGTINDKPALNGGGVSVFSAQILQDPNVQLPPFDPASGNALSAVFDMKLRNGNEQKYEHIFQASLLGTDLSMEGPLSGKKRASFLFNYRYSTVGLLSLMGVNFGGDQIGYHDLSLVLTFPVRNGQLRLFGIAGASKTIFRGPEDSTKFLLEKDLENIDFHSFTTINGLNFIKSINNTVLWRTVIAYSAKEISRFSRPSGYSGQYIPVQQDRYAQKKISTLHYLSKRFGNQLRLKAGADISCFISSLRSSLDNENATGGKITDLLVQPFASIEGNLFSRFEYRAGLHLFYQPRIGAAILQPRLMFTWNLSKEQFVRFSYGISSQLQPFFLYLNASGNSTLQPTSVQSFSLIHHLSYRGIEFRNELFYHYFTQVPEQEQMHFSGISYFNEQISFPLQSSGTGTAYGYDLTMEKNFRMAYLILSGSIFRCMESERAARFNSNYTISLTAGKEYTIRKDKVFSTDLRFFTRKGFLEQEDPQNIVDYNYTRQLAAYYRADARLSYRKNKRKSSVIWALDLQNITDRKNIAYHSPDRYLHTIVTHYQLGIIPVLSYKIMF